MSLVSFAPSSIGTSLELSTGAAALVVLACAIIAVTLSLRVITLFPAIAVDAPDANWRRAIADTDGHAWHIFGILFSLCSR